MRGAPLHVAHAIRLPGPFGNAGDDAEGASPAKRGAAVVDRFEAVARSEFPA